MATLTSPRALRTRARILDAALDLFETRGYDATTVAQVAAAAGITQMTFFRHFPTKDAVLVSDPYDPLIADAVGTQARDLAPLERVRRGMLAALADVTPTEDTTAHRRVALVAANPRLRAAVVTATAATERAIADRLVADGVARFDATVAAAACLGACTAALLARTDAATSLADTVTRALEVLRG
ncbi:TetR/AcrR family transcriptional regulator [Krasilnikoviella flava]|uniref:Transcriptional regulator, TetR family n=1 Tax=Krasilnikoviella flava TaxID=526729 RepID=A0A1T5IP71_9MICO|nr:TetR/AcrR family transcriptional regulator [Krasilnikoviella flava]SKC40976.1 transcriptional regulator, TetR family [Krasilnikoviella flava]